ncbi:MAG TPA: sulfotransferase domain-containing protein, partial [Terriglobales bacterium]|nr:sulfotransferase domain-containing protein [Terriglobales bacterium]
FIVSYPRSGNTWTRFLVANLVHPEQPVTFANIERLIPDAEAQSSRYMKSVSRPRMIKSHQYFDPRYKKVIYVVRDPRDVALSYYDFARKYRQIDDGYSLATYVSDFAAGRLSSADWGTWGENVASWIYTRNGQPGFLLLRYEDMLGDTERELAKVAGFLGIEPESKRLTAACERSSAEHMRSLESVQAEQWVTTKNKRSDIPFVRTAASGLWKSKLPANAIGEIESAWGPLMKNLGYELVSTSPAFDPDGRAIVSGSSELVREPI